MPELGVVDRELSPNATKKLSKIEILTLSTGKMCQFSCHRSIKEKNAAIQLQANPQQDYLRDPKTGASFHHGESRKKPDGKVAFDA